MKIMLKAFLVTLLLAFIFFFGFLPRIIDQTKNGVTIPLLNPAKVNWYDSIPFIADLHCDALLWDRNLQREHVIGHVDLPRMQQANMALQVFSIVTKTPKNMNIEHNDDKTDNITLLGIAQLRPLKTWFDLTERALQQCADLQAYEASSQGKFSIISSSQQLQQFVANRQKNGSLQAGMLGIEGAHCLGNNIQNLQRLFDAGVRYIGLAHFFDNEWAGSAHGMAKGGLTNAGRLLVQKMDSLHITIDLAHASAATINDVLALSTKPILVSHTGVQGVCKNQRNLSDAQIDAIGKSNGLIGIGLWETAVCGKDAAATARSIRYVANRIGVDKVALGSDFDGAIETHFAVTGLPLMVDALLKEGFNRSEIEAIMGGNIRDFFIKNLPAN